MQIILVQAEIEKAIRNFVNSKVQVNEGQDIRIELSASRGPEGFRATIDIIDDELTPATTKANTETKDEQAAAVAAAAKAKAAEAEVKKKADMAAAAEQAALEKEQEREAVSVTKEVTSDEPGDGSTEPPFEPDARAEASEQPAAPRKPLFGRTNAALNA